MTSSYVASLSPLATYFNSMSNVSGSGNYTNYYSTAMGSNANFSSEEDYNSYMNALYNDREVSMSSQLGTRNGDKVTKLASTMQTALHEGDSKLVKQILTSIEDDPTTLASLEIAYGNAAGSPTADRKDWCRRKAAPTSRIAHKKHFCSYQNLLFLHRSRIVIVRNSGAARYRYLTVRFYRAGTSCRHRHIPAVRVSCDSRA